MKYHINLKSNNAKTGAIPVSTSPHSTCPTSCPLRGNGCYAGQGPLSWHWKAVSDGRRGDDWATFLKTVARIPAGQLWRHNQAGDLPGRGDRINARSLGQLARANRGKRGWTYTHKPVVGTSPVAIRNREAVRKANADGFVVNLSANSMAHADQLKAADCGPVVVVVPHDSPPTTFTPAGHKVVVCPAQRDERITCAQCGLCARQRSVVVGFLAHGQSFRKVEAVCS